MGKFIPAKDGLLEVDVEKRRSERASSRSPKMYRGPSLESAILVVTAETDLMALILIVEDGAGQEYFPTIMVALNICE